METHTMIRQLLTLIGGLLLVFIITAGITYLFAPGFINDAFDFAKSGKTLSLEEFNAGEDVLRGGNELAKYGNYNEAAAVFEDVVANGADQFTADQIARAARSTIFRYRVTGDPKDSLQAVRDLKAVILDESVSAKHRASSINTLATGYCWFGRDDAVVQEIYGEEPFAQYWSGDPNVSVRDMLVWSMEVYPTPKAAATLSYWYADLVLKNDYVKKTLTDTERAEYIQKAQEYLDEADALSIRDEKESSGYKDTQRYIGYLYRRAVGVGTLAVVGKASVQDFENAYDLFFAESARQDNHNGSGYVPFAYVWRAKFAQLLGMDAAVSQDLLRKAVAAINADPVPQANELVDFIADKANDNDGRFSWHAIQTLREIAPEFDAFVADVEAANR